MKVWGLFLCCNFHESLYGNLAISPADSSVISRYNGKLRERRGVVKVFSICTDRKNKASLS